MKKSFWAGYPPTALVLVYLHTCSKRAHQASTSSRTPASNNSRHAAFDPHDRPWGGEEEGSPAGAEIMQGSAADGKQFARMQYVLAPDQNVPAATSRFCFNESM